MQALLSCFSKNYHNKGLPASATNSPPAPPPKVTYAILEKEDASASSAVIRWLEKEPKFIALSKFETVLIMNRDQEDDEKLATGVRHSISIGVINTLETPPKYKEISVSGKTPEEVCSVITTDVKNSRSAGNVIVLCGLSGTGKGTTVAKLQELLPNTVTWSNGNIFRSLTLLAVTWCRLFNLPQFDKDAALTPANLAGFVRMLSFGQFNGEWDIKITGLGIDTYVSEIKNTLLKSPEVAKNIPTVAALTQGEVINFASQAIKQMSASGVNVIVEGREATVNYVETEFRYTLVLEDTQVIGQRRAAQRIDAAVVKELSAKPEEERTEEHVAEAITRTLDQFIEELKGEEAAAEFLKEIPSENGAAENGEDDDKEEDDL